MKTWTDILKSHILLSKMPDGSDYLMVYKVLDDLVFYRYINPKGTGKNYMGLQDFIGFIDGFYTYTEAIREVPETIGFFTPDEIVKIRMESNENYTRQNT